MRSGCLLLVLVALLAAAWVCIGKRASDAGQVHGIAQALELAPADTAACPGD